ncbi:MAG: 5'-nucleotidase C-terminal domain-containing protein [Treponemataceae bacterium]|nr:5'-nucleotidase C-terminal domain-containing protein [Treponemataceae bacterium]
MKSLFKKIGLISLILASVFMVFSCASAPKIESVPREAGVAYTLTLVHTNDHHGATLSKDGSYGLAERATYIKQIRAENKNVLLLDAGDINTGTALSNMFYAEPDIFAYNMMGYEAVSFGNHEFDGTLAKLEDQIAKADFAWMAANITRKDGSFLGKPYITRDYEGFRVGVLGLTTLRTLVIASPDASLTFADEVETAAKYVDILRNKEKCDIIIVLGHLGDIEEAAGQNTSLKIAEKVDGIDIIVDGHAHSFFEEPRKVNNTWIVSSNEWGKYVGTGTLTVVDGALVSFDWHAEKITSEAYPADADILAMLDPYIVKANESLKEVVFQTVSGLPAGNKDSRKWETAIGDFVADAQDGYLASHGVSVDFGFTNGGNIRADFPAGDVTRENVLTVLPFENYVYVVTLNGSDVADLFQFIATLNQGAGGFPQMSKNVKYTLTYDAEGKNGQISDVTISGEPIDTSRTYRIAINNYLAEGGDGYEVLTRSIDTFNTSMLMSDVVIEYAQSLTEPVSAETSGRITVIGGISK